MKLLKNSQFWADEHSRFLVVQPTDFWCKQRVGPSATRTRCRLMPRSRRWRMSWVWLSWRLVSCIKIGGKQHGTESFWENYGTESIKDYIYGDLLSDMTFFAFSRWDLSSDIWSRWCFPCNSPNETVPRNRGDGMPCPSLWWGHDFETRRQGWSDLGLLFSAIGVLA